MRWTADGGMVGLGDLPGGVYSSTAESISADGSVIVGVANLDLPSISTGEAFRWTADEGMVSLGDLPGGDYLSVADDVSADGSVIVGSGTSASGLEAFRWTAAGGMVGLGDLSGGRFESDAFDVSADGSLIVGRGSSRAGTEAFLWTAGSGMVSLRQLLIAGGATGLTGWTLTQASAVSADGRTIAGVGRNPRGQTEAWLATIHELPPSGDFDASGLVEQADLDLVLLNWGTELVNPGAVGWINDLPQGPVEQTELDQVLLNWGASSALTAAAVPEPATLLLLVVACAAISKDKEKVSGTNGT
jgi:probable HAF family extracellular repeat protein